LRKPEPFFQFFVPLKSAINLRVKKLLQFIFETHIQKITRQKKVKIKTAELINTIIKPDFFLINQ